MYRIDFIATWVFPHDGSSLFTSETSKSDSSEFNIITSLGGRHYHLNIVKVSNP